MTTIKTILLALLAVVPCSIAWAQSERIVTNARLCGIVGVAGVVDETYVGVDVSTHIKSQGASPEMEIA